KGGACMRSHGPRGARHHRPTRSALRVVRFEVFEAEAARPGRVAGFLSGFGAFATGFSPLAVTRKRGALRPTLSASNAEGQRLLTGQLTQAGRNAVHTRRP